MADQLQPSQTSGYVLNNTGYLSESVIRMRLDTTKLLADLEAFYRGTRVVGYEELEDGSIRPRFESLGKARMNDLGIQDIMSWLSSLFNPSTVQGNFDAEDLSNFMADLHGDIAEDLMTNMHEYGIDERDFNPILDKTINVAFVFFTRTKDNLERESYASTLRSVERLGDQSAGWQKWNPFAKRG